MFLVVVSFSFSSMKITLVVGQQAESQKNFNHETVTKDKQYAIIVIARH